MTVRGLIFSGRVNLTNSKYNLIGLEMIQKKILINVARGS
jgi:hypothetical protein